MTMKVTSLSQEVADQLMKSLDADGAYFRNFKDAFNDERRQVHDRSQLWALSEKERSYYLVEPYLFGINFQNPDLISISSFARILHATSSHTCASCLKLLVKETLFPICVAQDKRIINAALTEKGKRVFEELKKQLHGVEIVVSQPYHFATISCEEARL
jgi:hypothetical protein